jgi:hypothetical protein
MAGRDLAGMRTLLLRCAEMMQRIQRIPQPVLASVAGLATAAGCQLVATCDLAVASSEARFAAPGGRGGLFCHTPMVAVSRAVGRKRALELLLTGDPIDAATAADWGLVNRVVALGELEAASWELLERATRGSAFSKGLGKQSYYAQIDLDQPKAYDYASEGDGLGVSTPRRAGGDARSSRSAGRCSRSEPPPAECCEGSQPRREQQRASRLGQPEDLAVEVDDVEVARGVFAERRDRRDRAHVRREDGIARMVGEAGEVGPVREDGAVPVQTSDHKCPVPKSPKK